MTFRIPLKSPTLCTGTVRFQPRVSPYRRWFLAQLKPFVSVSQFSVSSSDFSANFLQSFLGKLRVNTFIFDCFVCRQRKQKICSRWRQRGLIIPFAYRLNNDTHPIVLELYNNIQRPHQKAITSIRKLNFRSRVNYLLFSRKLLSFPKIAESFSHLMFLSW